MGRRFQQRNGITGLQNALLQHPEIDAAAPGMHELLHHPGIIKPNAQFETRHARLHGHEHRRAHPKHVADANLRFQQAGGGQVLTESGSR
jgi:hypothetical protein